MKKSESQKAASRKWDGSNICTLCCRIRSEKAQAFKEACARRGTNPNAVFRSAIDKMLEEDLKVGETDEVH